MYYVYCLVSLKNPRFHYYGYTSDIVKRIKCHKQGKVRTTNRFRPVELKWYKKFEIKEEALRYERDLKKKASYRNRVIREINNSSSQGSPA